MPLGRSKTPATSPPVRIALVGGVFKIAGVRHMVRAGERLAANHPLVEARPAMFAPDGTSDAQIDAARQAYVDAKPATREEPRHRSPYAGLKAQDPIIRVSER